MRMTESNDFLDLLAHQPHEKLGVIYGHWYKVTCIWVRVDNRIRVVA